MKTKAIIFNTTTDSLVDVKEALGHSQYQVIADSSCLSDVTRAVFNGSVELVIAVTDKRFDPLFAAVGQIVKQHTVPIVVFTYDDSRDVIQLAIKTGVAAYIVDGLQANRVVSILDTACLRFNEQQRLLSELNKTKESLLERKLIEKAKGILMKRSAQDENSVYQSMRRAAMNKNIKLADLAKSIIDSHELMA